MNIDGLSPSELIESGSSIWQACDSLSDLLSKATDLRNACQTALDFLLQELERPAGLILIPKIEETDSIFTASPLVSERWLEQISDASSPLRQLAGHVYLTGSIFPGSELPEHLETPTDLACILPIDVTQEIIAVLIIQGKPCSTLEIENLTQFDKPIGRTIQIFCSQIALQDRTKDLVKLQMDLAQMGFSTDFEGLQAHMIQGINRILGGEASAFVFLDENHKEWMIRKSLGGDSEWIYQVNPREGKGLVKQCLRKDQVVCVNDISNNSHYDPSSDGLSGLKVRSLLCAPMRVNGKVVGAVQVLNKKKGEFDDHDQDLLCMATLLAANALQGTRMIQDLKIANADLEASRWELLSSRNTLRAIFDNLPAALYIIDKDYKIAAINKSRAKLAEQTPQAMVGKPCYQMLFKRDAPCPECLVGKTLLEGEKIQRRERRWNETRDDSSEWEISSYPIYSENEKVAQAILLEQDVTERHRLEAILTQSEKLAAVGQLAAGIAHEINNPLTAIIANAQILHREIGPDEDLQESVDLIARAGARAAQVVRNLLDFARKEEYHLGITDLNETLNKALDLVQHELLARGVKLDFNPDPHLPTIYASQDHLQSVWLNLLLNSLDSLDKKPGEVKITTQYTNNEIHVSVADNGKGISPDNLTRVFEPFYTTKAPGRGTGLGLSVSHRIVKQHGGYIQVESQVGVGSVFTVVIPANY
jgi:two-component system NtrC family sensor kinase